MFLFVLITFNSILGDFLRFWQIQKSKMADQDGGRSEMTTQLLRHVTSSPHDVDVNRDIFRRTIHAPSIVVIAFIFSELRRGGGIRPPSPHPPVVEDQKKPGLNRVNLMNTLDSPGTYINLHTCIIPT